MERWIYLGIGIIALAIVAGGLTQSSLAWGGRGPAPDVSLVHPTARATLPATTSPVPSIMPPVSASLSPSATPAPTPAATPNGPTATTVSFVRLRAGASTSSGVLAELQGGTVLQLGTYQDSQWQQVSYNGLNGYVFRSYLQYNR